MPEVSRVIPIRSIVARRRDARVDTSSVGIPNVDIDALHRLACLDVQVLDFEMKVDAITVLCLLNVLANDLASHIIRPIRDLGRYHTASVGGEDGILRGIDVVFEDAGAIVVDWTSARQCRRTAITRAMNVLAS